MTIHASWKADQGSSACALDNGTAHWTADLDTSAGGDPSLPNPHDLLDSALAACTTLTIQLYAKRKAYPIRSVAVSVAHIEEAGKYQLKRTIKIEGELEQQVLDDLLRVANRCPVHKSLSAQISIETSLA